MPQAYAAILGDPAVRVPLRLAWEDSQPGTAIAHEEGGFVLRDETGELTTLRWPRGSQKSILMPSHTGCRIGEKHIAATFHTHPNVASEYLQEPGETDRRAVRDDPDLKGKFYVGEFVISYARTYLIGPNGQVIDVGETAALLT